jgi:hypothetical protein
MRDDFPGYYRPSAKEFEELWGEALIVPDANVLLTLYRLGDTTRERLLDILKELQERLFLPYQAGFEFQKNRLTVIAAQEAVYDTVTGQIEDFAGSLGRELRQHPRLDRKDLEKRLEEALNPVREYVEEVRAQHPDPLSEDAIGADSVRDILDEVFAGRVGPERDLQGLVTEGAERYEQKRPPGYEDKDKNEPDRFGDLAIWLDTIDAAKRESKDVIFVTAERKEDWWWVREGQRIGARPELIAEMREKASQSVYLYDVKRFMEEASKALGLSEFSEDERQDVARAQKASVSHVIPKFASFKFEDWPNAARIIPSDLNVADVRLDPKTIEWLSNIDTSKFAWPSSGLEAMRWHSSAHVDDEGVALHLSLKPEFFVPSAWHTGRQISCLVTGPGGGESQAVTVNAGHSATFTYPDDFRGSIENVEGSYDYNWFVAGGIEGFNVPSGQVASGSFELSGSRPDGPPEPGPT